MKKIIMKVDNKIIYEFGFPSNLIDAELIAILEKKYSCKVEVK